MIASYVFGNLQDNMYKPTLSIVIATYNGARFLREQLDSVYFQTLQADEVLAVDDCSTDETVAILEEYHQRYGLKYVVNKHNLRVNANFEKGMRLAKGDYISLCDQDDVWFREKNETLYKKLQELEAEYGLNAPCCVSSRNTFVDENLNVHHNTERPTDTNDFRDTIIHHLSQGSSMMFNRTCLKHILPLPSHEDNICYDSHIGYILAMVGHKYDLRQSLMYYRVHGNNITASLGATFVKSPICRKRSTSVVPLHMIRTFIHAKSFVEEQSTEKKLLYVKDIIELSKDINIFKRFFLLLKTKHIPFPRKVYSFKAAILNIFLS